MSNAQHQNGQSSGFNPLSLLQQASNNRTHVNTSNDGTDSVRSQGNMSFSSSGIVTSNPSTVCLQQQQSQQLSGQGINDARSELMSMALSGDLAKALQLANFGLPGNGNGFGMAGNNAAGGLGSAGAVYQQLQQLGLQRLQAMQQTNNSSNLVEESISAATDQKSPASFQAASSTNSIQTPSVQTLEKEEKRNNPTAVVPCRARGMSMEHNFQTAYFDIADDIKHGDGLICSFPECRNRGVKFLYCSYCKDPVAKRNFRNRHNHADLANSKGAAESAGAKKSTSKPLSRHKQKKQPPICSVFSKKSNQISEGSRFGSSISKSMDPRDSKKRPASSMVTSDATEILSRKLAKIEPVRKEAWDYLLANRPGTDQGDDMSAWLMQVMAVSDSRRPLSEVNVHLGAIYKQTGAVASIPVTNESSFSHIDARHGSIDSESSSSPTSNSETSSNDGFNESSPIDGSSNGDSNDSSEDNREASTECSSETQDPTGIS